MTQISPTTKDVKEAVDAISWDWASMEPSSPNVIAAAALQTVADQMQQMYWEPKCVEHLRFIANELKNY